MRAQHALRTAVAFAVAASQAVVRLRGAQAIAVLADEWAALTQRIEEDWGGLENEEGLSLDAALDAVVDTDAEEAVTEAEPRDEARPARSLSSQLGNVWKGIFG